VVPVVTRVTEEDDDLGGTRVPAGTIVIMSLQGEGGGVRGAPRAQCSFHAADESATLAFDV
jgi:hypothetical protein